MNEPYKSYVQQLLQNGLRSRRNYFFEHIDARSLIEPSPIPIHYRSGQLHVSSDDALK